MPLQTLDDLFHDTLRDVYYAEKKLTKVLPKMAKNATNPDLQKAFKNHLSETEGHVGRLEQVFKLIDKPARGKKCDAMDGLAKEGEHVIEEGEDETVLDAGLIASAQAVEHYEIARYGALVGWAAQLGNNKAAALLQKTLDEEKACDELLNGLSGDINAAAAAPAEDEEEEAA
jgi:ferritin-like metal-binding protein YciE